MSTTEAENPSVCDNAEVVGHLRILQHLQNPQNLITYMIFTMWSKYMGIASYLPSITIG